MNNHLACCELAIRAVMDYSGADEDEIMDTLEYLFNLRRAARNWPDLREAVNKEERGGWDK